MAKTEKTGLDLLREPFPPNAISKLPKPTKKQTEEVKADFKKGIRCQECGAWHHPQVVHLDYVGHAALTNRLLDADPAWNWEPVAFDEHGAPLMDRNGGMWIRLTVCGQTRLGYGHADGKSGGDAVKEVIGDALRNAAMRFGAALDLWHKGDLHAVDGPTGDAVEAVGEQEPPFPHRERTDEILGLIEGCKTQQNLRDVWTGNAATLKRIEAEKPPMFAELVGAKDKAKARLTDDPARQAPPMDEGRAA